MTEQEWKARQQREVARYLREQEQRRQREMCEWCVVWFAQRLGESNA